MWDKIKKLLQKEGGKCIIIEKGEPTYLVQKLDDDNEFSSAKREVSDWEKINKNVEELTAEEEEKEQENLNTEQNNIKIEDLPF